MPVIAYIGRRPFHRDVTYGTGDWTHGQSKIVDDALAFRMLKHPDVYRESSDDKAVVVEVQPKECNIEDEVQYAEDSITRMGTDALRSFVNENFQQKLDGRLSVESMRREATRMLHLYGLPGSPS